MVWNDLLRENSLDALLLSDSKNIRYVTGFHGVSDHEREGYVLLTKTNIYLFTFRLYQEDAEKCQRENPNLEIQFISGNTPLSQQLEVITTENSIQTLGIEALSLTVKEHNDLVQTLTSITVVPTNSLLEKVRSKKTDLELTTIMKAISITDDCFTFIQTRVKEGITEGELAWDIENFFRSHQAKNSFTPIVAFNDHASIPHHTSSDSCKLAADSLILLDFGAEYEGYHADMTRVIFFGKPKHEWVKAYQAVLTAQEDALTYLSSRPSPSGSKADEMARTTVEKTGFPAYPHSLGHGVGLDIHELPRLTVHRDYILEEGEIFSVEPGTYLPGKFGIRIEDLVLKTKDGIEVLSKSSKEIIILS